MKRLLYIAVLFSLHLFLIGKSAMQKNESKFVIYVGNDTINLEKVRIRVHQSYDGQDFREIIDDIFENEDDPHIEYTFSLPKFDREEGGMILIAEVVENDIIICRASIDFDFPKKDPPNIEISYGDKFAIGKEAYFSFTLFHGDPGYD